ncbi:MAG: manganese-binding transcriptional regulator MntR [Fimbriimonadaceae bacterium]|nr:manganese-binding transcriptional regulator MntR [Fimbriimonadaceae bacterium]MCC7102693.1 manganese-binding transcriptional regulator MntR [Fimbriimonadaceae bacterium]
MRDQKSARYIQTRDAHRAELAEDYVEAILDLIDEDGHAKLTEIAWRLGVAHPTAFKSLRRLEAEGLVELTPYKPVQLTPKGMELALACRVRHEAVVNFLVSLGVPQGQAELDAEGIEHHVSDVTIQAIQARMKTLRV